MYITLMAISRASRAQETSSVHKTIHMENIIPAYGKLPPLRIHNGICMQAKLIYIPSQFGGGLHSLYTCAYMALSWSHSQTPTPSEEGNIK